MSTSKPTLTLADFSEAAARLNCEVPAIRAVCQVEAPRGGFNPDGTPVTLFEGHKFHKFTGGRFDAQAPDLSYPKWTKKFYGKDWMQEQDRLQRAMALDRDAALRSASWGKFQIMGFNHAVVGFPTVQKFVNAMYTGEREHLLAFVQYVVNNNLVGTLRRRDWAAFALGYNGEGYAENKYDVKMAAAYLTFKKKEA
ncbi:N-acetylmuramidase family protein [Polaromonas sp.]|uniref:N-acetylmuramidase family protein n=1 Tax=Polaromonas sp. TaxID=1869339 RepID=UPI00272FAD12|nr:N-acetylmuramidase family protein [Polaromonas sp.]MDP1886648.1 N-acetylmuramidase family protein [Polaromonas sp.]